MNTFTMAFITFLMIMVGVVAFLVMSYVCNQCIDNVVVLEQRIEELETENKILKDIVDTTHQEMTNSFAKLQTSYSKVNNLALNFANEIASLQEHENGLSGVKRKRSRTNQDDLSNDNG